MDRVKLSRQEEHVLAFAISGLADREVAARMGLSTETVRTYWKRIRNKIGAKSRHEAIAMRVSEQEHAKYASRFAEFETSERMYRDAFDVLYDGLIIADHSIHCVEVNPAACDLLHADHDGIVGNCLDGLSFDGSRDQLETLWQDQLIYEKWSGELQYSNGNGSPVRLECRSTPHFARRLVVMLVRNAPEEVKGFPGL